MESKITPVLDSQEEEPKNVLAKSGDERVTGVWKGTIETPQGASDLELILKMKSKTDISGSYETTRSDGEIIGGKFSPDDSSLALTAENERFTLEFSGTLSGDSYDGQVELNDGAFSMEFSVEKVSSQVKAMDKEKDQTNVKQILGSKLADLLPGPRWVSSLHASKFEASRCYITFDGHRSNDDTPYLFVSEDYGMTWKSIKGNLPNSAGSARVLREDLVNENVLYLGCEFGAWVSVDQGQTWSKFKNLPTVSVHEIAQHPTLNEIVFGTHGRSIWIANVSLLRQFKADIVGNGESHLFEPDNVILWDRKPRRGSNGTRRFVSENPKSELELYLQVGKDSPVSDLVVTDIRGETLKRFEIGNSKGLLRLTWGLRNESQNRGRPGRRVKPGQYLVKMRSGGKLQQHAFAIESDPESDFVGGQPESEMERWGEFDLFLGD